MRIMGIDPGTYSMGVGIVSSNGADFTMEYLDVIKPKRKDPLELRLLFLFNSLSKIVSEWNPLEIAIEEPFAAKNIKTAIAIGHAHAVAMVVAAKNSLAVSGYAPRSVKRAVTDYGGSSKEQVQEMVRILLDLKVLPPTDAADALAVAICHLNAREFLNLNFQE